MKNNLLFLLFSCSFYLEAQEYKDFCSNVDGVREIQAASACLGSSNVLSCDNLGALVAGGAAAAGYTAKIVVEDLIKDKQLKLQSNLGESYLKYVQSSRLEITNADAFEKDLTEKISKTQKSQGMGALDRGLGWDEHMRSEEIKLKKEMAAFQKARAEALKTGSKVYTPIIQEIDGVLYDVANDKEISKKLIDKYQEAANFLKTKLGHKPAYYGEDLAYQVSEKWTKDNNAIRISLGPNGSGGSVRYIERELIGPRGAGIAQREFLEFVQNPMLKTAEKTTASGLVSRIIQNASARKIGQYAGAAAGGFVGVGLAVGAEVVTISKTACATIVDAYTSVDENCKPTHEIDANVNAFFDLSPHLQLELLKQPKICQFYTKLHKKTFQRPQFTSLKCDKRDSDLKGMSVVTKHDNKIFEHEVKFYNSKVTALKVSADGQLPYKIMFDSVTGNLTSYEFERGSKLQKVDARKSIDNIYRARVQLANDQLKSSQLFLPELKKCCSENSDSDAESCMKKYNLKGIPTKSNAKPVHRQN